MWSLLGKMKSLQKYEPYFEFLIKEERIFRLGIAGRRFEWGESKNEDNDWNKYRRLKKSGGVFIWRGKDC